MNVYRVEIVDERGTVTSKTKTFSTFELADKYLEKYLLETALELGDLPENEDIEITSYTQITFWIDCTGASYYNSSVLRAFKSNCYGKTLLIQEKVHEN